MVICFAQPQPQLQINPFLRGKKRKQVSMNHTFVLNFQQFQANNSQIVSGPKIPGSQIVGYC